MYLNLKMKNMKKTFLLIMIISFSCFESYAKTIDMDLCNFIQINETEFRVDVRVRNTTADPSGAGAIAIGQWAIRISLNPSLNNGLSTPYSCSYVGNATLTTGENVPIPGNTQAYWSPNTYFQSFSDGVTPGQPATLLNSTDWVYIGTFKMQCKNGASLRNWTSFAPNLSWTAGTFNGMLECNWFDNEQGNGTLSILRSDATDYPVTVNYTVTIPNNTVPLYSYAYTGINTWSATANWNTSCSTGNGKNIIPSATDNISIGKYTNSTTPGVTAGTCTLDANPTVNNLNITSGSNLTINAAKQLTVSGTITNNAGASGLVIKSSTSTPNGSLVFNNAQNSPVTATVEMYSKASTDVNAATGSKYNFQFFGVPVRSMTALPFTGNDVVVRQMAESGNSPGTRWLSLIASSSMTSFTGYEIVQAAPTTYTFTGQLENSNLSKNLAYTSGATYPGQSLIANPYTAAIDITKIVFGSQTEASVYLFNTGSLSNWTANSGSTDGTNPGQYTVSTSATAGSGQIPAQIPSMQAFVVRALSGSANATIGIPYSTAVTPNTDQQRVRATVNKVYTTIDVTGSRFADRMWIFTDPSCTRTFDNGWDGRKMLGSSLTPQLCAMESDDNYQIDAVADINNTELGFLPGEDTNYTLTFTHTNRDANETLYLVDLLVNKTVDITASGSTYSFAAKTTQATNPVKRFRISTSPTVATEITDLGNIQLKVFSFDKTITIDNRSNSVKGDLEIYDIAGRMQQSVQFDANSISTLSTSLKTGTYIIKAIINNKVITVNHISIR